MLILRKFLEVSFQMLIVHQGYAKVVCARLAFQLLNVASKPRMTYS